MSSLKAEAAGLGTEYQGTSDPSWTQSAVAWGYFSGEEPGTRGRFMDQGAGHLADKHSFCFQNGFAVVRPPGHHADHSTAM